MRWVSITFVLLLLGRAIYTDVRRGVIENKYMLTGLILGLICTYVEKGIDGVLVSLKMALLIFVVLFVLFLIKGLGAGDIKLFCVLATFYPTDVIAIVVVSFIVGAGIAIGKMVQRMLKKQSLHIWGEKINFSVPIGCGTLLVLLSQWIESG